MSATFIVWICVEEYDEREGRGQDIDLPFPSKRTFTGRRALQQAIDYATALQEDCEPRAWRGRGKKAAQP